MTSRMTAAELIAMPTKGKRRDIEGPIHRAILAHLRMVLPSGAIVHHSPNEMNLAGDPKAKAIAQSKAKALGMVPGWPDLEIIYSGRVYFLEVKGPKGRQSPDQENVETAMAFTRTPYAVVRSVAETGEVLLAWRLI